MTEQKWRLAAGKDWATLSAQARSVVPEAFDASGNPLNLLDGKWGHPGTPKEFSSAVDGSPLGPFPMLDLASADKAVRAAAGEFKAWSKVGLEERKKRVHATIEQLRTHRELLAGLLVWEIGKPWAQALVSVDRCISGVEWYLEKIGGMLEGRSPLGLVSNIASWNYPMSVLMHSVLVQCLAGDATIAKTPSDGGLYTLTVAMGLARREGLPVSLVSGSGGQLSEALVRHPEVACLSFVGGKSSGRDIAPSLYEGQKRYMLEMEGINAQGVWNFSDWDALEKQMRKGFEYGKQRCTAYARYVVERRLFPRFLDMYLGIVKSLSFGHPLLTDQPGGAPAPFVFGPLINARAVKELKGKLADALSHGAVALYEGSLSTGHFLPGQDTSGYIAPVAVLNPPRHSKLYHAEPFGPVDSFVVVDTVDQLIAEMNVSNGALVASVACDDPAQGAMIGAELRAFKVGINRVRSRGDNEEAFGGMGASWKGCFVGGKYLVQAVTVGAPGERLYGNFPDARILPEVR